MAPACASGALPMTSSPEPSSHPTFSGSEFGRRHRHDGSSDRVAPATSPPSTTVSTAVPGAGPPSTVATGLGPPTPFVPASPASPTSPTPGLPSASTPTSTPGSTAKTPGSTTFGGGAPGQTHSALPGIHPVHEGFDWWILLIIAMGVLGAAFAAIGWRTYSSARRR